MRIRCANCGQGVDVADTGVLPPSCPHCRGRPVPERLGRFRVVRLLASGGMGEVYLGEHEELATRVALKLLPQPQGVDGHAVLERFRREARLTAAIRHPGVVSVLDLVEDQGRVFLVLELVDGTSLRSRLRRGPVEPGEAVRIAVAVADVLLAAHRCGVVHRDVKPENVMLCSDGRVRVLDFGIARALQDQEPLTRTGEILGTPEYMAPEQLLEAGDAVDARTDVHALGVLTYELLTGKSPFAGATLFQALKLVESLVPPPPSRLRPGVSAAVDAVVGRAMAKDPAERFADAGAFAAALRGEASPAGRAPAAVRRRVAATRLVGLLVVAAAGLLAGAWFGGVFSHRPTDGKGDGVDAASRGAVDRTGHLAAAREARRALSSAELAALLPREAWNPGERDRARELVRELTSDDQPPVDEDAVRIGRAMLRLGLFQGALQVLDDAARRSVPGARPAAAVAWHAVYALWPAAVGAPPWFAAVDRRRRDRLVGAADGHGDGREITAADGDALGDALVGACAALARGDGAAAWTRLHAVAEAGWTAEHATVALLAARSACADRQAFATHAEPLLRRFDAPSVRLLGMEPLLARDMLRDLANDAPTDSGDRWLLEFAAAAGTALATGEVPRRLRSAAELAWLHGAGGAVPFWLVSVRVLAAQRGTPLSADEARGLQTLFDADWRGESPAGDVARALVDVHLGAGSAEQLRALELSAGPGLALFTAWGAAPSSTVSAPFALLFGGRASLPDVFPAAIDVPAAMAHAAAALADREASARAADRRREHWQQAMLQPADLEAFAWLPSAGPAQLAELLDLLRAVPPEGPSPPGFASAVRLCARAGCDLGELRQRVLSELTGGID